MCVRVCIFWSDSWVCATRFECFQFEATVVSTPTTCGSLSALTSCWNDAPQGLQSPLREQYSSGPKLAKYMCTECGFFFFFFCLFLCSQLLKKREGQEEMKTEWGKGTAIRGSRWEKYWREGKDFPQVVSGVVQQSTLCTVARVLRWSDSSDFDSSVKSKQLLKEADLSRGRRGGGESAERGRKREGEEQQRGKSQVTKSRHIPDKPLHHIAALHHTENNALILGEGGPYLHTHPTCSYQRRYKLELPHHTWTPANGRNGMREKVCGTRMTERWVVLAKLNPLWCQGKGVEEGESQRRKTTQPKGAGRCREGLETRGAVYKSARTDPIRRRFLHQWLKIKFKETKKVSLSCEGIVTCCTQRSMTATENTVWTTPVQKYNTCYNAKYVRYVWI